MIADNAAERAMVLARAAHAGQTDKAGEPYIHHVERVVGALAPDDIEGRAVAALHDVIEDCGITRQRLEAEFGPTIAAAVDALTRRAEEDYAAFIERCRELPLAVRVKRADLTDNMRLERLAVVTDEDRARVEKYRRALDRLTAP